MTKENDLNDQIKKLEKEIRFLNKKLQRSQEHRKQLELMKDKTQQVLKKVNQEVEEARQIIENQNIQLKELYSELEAEKKKTDELLFNILPEEIAEELKLTGKVEPVSFGCVSVLFTDFKGFTKITEKMTTKELVTELDLCFSEYDKITVKYKLEKLKTIGDSYMCAGGIPVPNKTHAIDAVLAGFKFLEFIENRRQLKMKTDSPYWEVRLGINSGPLLAGVVGHKKFAYDIWGDTVNIASRMESSGEPGRINVSQATYEIVKDFFDCSYRGKVMAKNKGEISMYFVEGIKPELCTAENSVEPDDAFYKLYNELKNSD